MRGFTIVDAKISDLLEKVREGSRGFERVREGSRFSDLLERVREGSRGFERV